MSLLETITELKHIIDQRHHQYISTAGPVDKNNREFFQKVKMEAMPLFDMNNQWKEQAESFVKKREVSVHPRQIQSTHENIEMIILHSFYADIPVKRFKELHQSVHYVLNMLIDDIKKTGSFSN